MPKLAREHFLFSKVKTDVKPEVSLMIRITTKNNGNAHLHHHYY